MPTIDIINRPANFLEGKTLAGGWIVKEKITKPFDPAVSSFAKSYIVERKEEDGKTKVALLKALDFSVALLDEEPTKALIMLAKSYDFEKELLELCKIQRLTKIVTIIDQGVIPPISGSIIQVPYFILEYAEKDVKSQIDFDSRLNTAWLLRILHNVTVGLWQLHSNGVAHKNVRPDSIMEFRKDLQKLTDIGNSDKKGFETPGKISPLAIDPAYYTPEFLYNHSETDWVHTSQATDAYLLGNLIFFLFTQTSFNTWLLHYLDDTHKPNEWSGTYEEVLTYLEEAYEKAILHFTAWVEEPKLKAELAGALRLLCHPNPRKRGHPLNIASIGSSLSVERFISLFRRLQVEAELEIK